MINSPSPIIFILVLSIIIQAAAALMAFRLIGITGRRAAWSFIAVALVLMAVRRVVPLYHLIIGDVSHPPDTLNEFIGLALSMFMVVGIARIAPLFLERKGAEEALAERVMLAELSADIGYALAKQADLRSILNACAEALVRRLDVAFARIWTLNTAENVLEMQASAGMYTMIDGSHNRIPVGKFKIGLIAEERKPHITNAVIGDPRVHDQEWAKREGMVAFAGHPLIIEDKLVGVMAMFSRKPFTDVTLKALAAGVNEIAVGIERKLAEEQLHRLNRELRAISSCNQALMRAEDEQTLLADICHIVCDAAGYRMAWVGYVENDDPRTIRPVAWAGAEDGYLEQAGIIWADTEQGRCPSGTAIQSGASTCVQDFTTAPQSAPWRDIALQRGYRSSIALPLKKENKIIFGILNIYSAEPNAFTPDEIRLLEELADDLAFGIMVLRVRNERTRTELERLGHLRFVESMDQINLAIQGTDDIQKMMSDVLDAVLEIFDCDRAWLLYPCDPEAVSWSVPMERTKPEYPGANVQGRVLPMDPEVRRMFRIQRGTDSPVSWGPGADYLYPEWLTEQFGVRSQLSVSTYPKTGQPWQFGMHQCSHARLWQPEEQRLFQEINRRLADGLTGLLAYRALRKSETKYRRIVETATEGIWMLGSDNMTTFVNARMADLLGYSGEEMIGRPVTDFMFEEDAADHLSKMDNRGQGISEHYERRFRCNNGQTVWALASATSIIDDEQHYQGSFAMFTDITERKQAEDKIRQSDQFIRSILDTVDEGFIVIDKDYRILTANKAYCNQFSLNDDNVIGRHCYEVSHNTSTPCSGAEHECAVKRVFEGRESRACTHIHHDSQGKPIHVEIKAYPFLKNESGEVITVIETIVDVTEKLKLGDQLLQAQKMESIGTLAGGIAHDFNNILTAIIGYGNIALMQMAKDDPQRLNIKHMLEAGGRAAHLTQDLLLFSRKQISERKPIDLNNVVRTVEKFLKRVIGEDVECRTKLIDKAMAVRGDAHQLEQVLMNLATNARDAMPKGGTFTISTEQVLFDEVFITRHGYGKPGSYVLTTISDTGKGIDAVTMEHIFEPFFTTKEAGKGTGLGLSVAYGIIKQHEGFVNVYSEHGHGTTFKIYLPLIVALADEEKIIVQALPVRGTETILLAEDDETVRGFTMTVLETFGYKVIAAKDGQEAVDKYKANKDTIQLLLLDLIMPKKTGKEVYDEIMAMTPGVKALFSSGYAPDMVRQQVLLDDSVAVVFKPITPTELLKQVREALDK
ncbi:MAG TPA: hypothetical protein DEQ20_04975 [Desulfobulbaceae bacterium]|nr:MAG: hypothetical protein A2520_03240 [Deltaproteobacteria bacterium RIFOXYD12_FULL_53_23]HCC54264.1 hypothetical protein [Desulfobulbaceae bacterium]